MCLIAFAFDPDAQQKLFVLANRDEFYGRAAKQAGFWEDIPGVLAGRDLEAGGTWLGVHTSGRFAAVTNYREPGRQVEDALTRGDLVTGFLKGSLSSEAYLNEIESESHRYNGFNLIVYDGENLGYFSNKSSEGPVLLTKGIFGLSNHLLDTPWPKVVRAKQGMKTLLDSFPDAHSIWTDMSAMHLFEDPTQAADGALPSTGVSLDLERTLSAMLIKSPNYGTRCTTMVGLWQDGRIRFAEKTLHPKGLDPAMLPFEIQPGFNAAPDLEF